MTQSEGQTAGSLDGAGLWVVTYAFVGGPVKGTQPANHHTSFLLRIKSSNLLCSSNNSATSGDGLGRPGVSYMAVVLKPSGKWTESAALMEADLSRLRWAAGVCTSDWDWSDVGSELVASFSERTLSTVESENHSSLQGTIWLARDQELGFGMHIDDAGRVIGLTKGRNGRPGPAAQAGVAVGSYVIGVGGATTSNKAEILDALKRCAKQRVLDFEIGLSALQQAPLPDPAITAAAPLTPSTTATAGAVPSSEHSFRGSELQEPIGHAGAVQALDSKRLYEGME